MFEWYMKKEKLQTRIPLCASCANRLAMRGRRASESLAYCKAVPGVLVRIQFPAYECSGYVVEVQMAIPSEVKGFAEAV